MRGLYYAFIYPYLSYVNIVWGSKYTTRLAPIRRLQNKIIRIITFSKLKEHTGPLFKQLSILPLHDINNDAILLCLCFDTTITIYHHLSMISFVWTKTFINTTQDHASYNVHKIQAWTNYQKHSVKYKGVSIWNNLTKSVKEIN